MNPPNGRGTRTGANRSVRWLVCLAAALTITAGVLVVWAKPFGPVASSGGLESLESFRALVKRQYASVEHLPTNKLNDLMRSKADVILFDVRAPEEYRISRIPGAVQVDPNVWTQAFLQRYAAASAGKTVIFYCSVGVRSSRLAERVGNGLRAAGARAVHNLDGGAFAWHGEDRQLVNESGSTSFIHPFSDRFSSLLKRPNLARSKL